MPAPKHFQDTSLLLDFAAVITNIRVYLYIYMHIYMCRCIYTKSYTPSAFGAFRRRSIMPQSVQIHAVM